MGLLYLQTVRSCPFYLQLLTVRAIDLWVSYQPSHFLHLTLSYWMTYWTDSTRIGIRDFISAIFVWYLQWVRIGFIICGYCFLLSFYVDVPSSSITNMIGCMLVDTPVSIRLTHRFVICPAFKSDVPLSWIPFVALPNLDRSLNLRRFPHVFTEGKSCSNIKHISWHSLSFVFSTFSSDFYCDICLILLLLSLFLRHLSIHPGHRSGIAAKTSIAMPMAASLDRTKIRFEKAFKLIRCVAIELLNC